jgi:hypothetical protein
VQGHRGSTDSHPPLKIENGNVAGPAFTNIKVNHLAACLLKPRWLAVDFSDLDDSRGSEKGVLRTRFDSQFTAAERYMSNAEYISYGQYLSCVVNSVLCAENHL